MLRVSSLLLVAFSLAVSYVQACSEYSGEFSCQNAGCAWCTGGSGCCVSGGSAGDACYCNIGGGGGTGMSAWQVVSIVAGCIFWICVCILCYRRCTQRQVAVVVRRTVVVQQTTPLLNNNGQPAVIPVATVGSPVVYAQQQPVVGSPYQQMPPPPPMQQPMGYGYSISNGSAVPPPPPPPEFAKEGPQGYRTAANI